MNEFEDDFEANFQEALEEEQTRGLSEAEAEYFRTPLRRTRRLIAKCLRGISRLLGTWEGKIDVYVDWSGMHDEALERQMRAMDTYWWSNDGVAERRRLAALPPEATPPSNGGPSA